MTAELIAAAEHWEQLAAAEDERAKWNRDHGRDLSKPGLSPGNYRAETYRRTARALRIEAETGRPHCSQCFGDHPNHLHPHLG